MILFEHGPGGEPALFDEAREVIVARRADQVRAAFARADAARAAGAWVAGYVAYEAGYALEPKLAGLMPRRRSGPLVALGLFDGPRDAGPVLARAGAEAGQARLSGLRRGIGRGRYDAAFARVADYIAAGDCYQINLTFPLSARLEAGTALGLYGKLRARQAVGYGVYADLGAGPVVISRSPELFFRVEGGVISARPMKGTAPRDPDPVRDAALAAELAASEKARAENLMIVDLLRNDIARISEVGSVKVPELFAVEPFATVHQMSSTVQGRLVAGADLGGLMAALFPCGSITGAPKIRAMEIIREVEGRARGVYCGAMGWMAPGGDAAWNVAIRTLSLFPEGRVVLNVGGGVVQDSTAAGEWEEALWKARYAEGLERRV
ncbi:aminodeoxychorismate synthase component I [Rhodobacteraceae bacterium HSP-20]|uniref:Aminodeoxychorismate synthase component I n=1 Tax=Paragemmobacter amnigenus TaxID=2852097 RepID=A0ABS6J2L5_9RHOB|nr:aminodeoxychorismate synthase component I [Rhodobacter amnigenus]MBV4388713.1 aminodeoxychorismate synthase component I [Rhodobacter amnigenus]